MEQITSSQLGHNIFNSCLMFAKRCWTQEDLSSLLSPPTTEEAVTSLDTILYGEQDITDTAIGEFFDKAVGTTEAVLTEELKRKYPKLVKEKANVNFREILVGYMWAIFDLLNTNSKYEKATHFLFGGYVRFLDLDKKDADEEMQFLEKRFDEYKDLFRKDGKIDYSYFTVALVMSEKIAHEEAVLFVVHLAISIQEFILMWDKLLNKIEIIDE